MGLFLLQTQKLEISAAVFVFSFIGQRVDFMQESKRVLRR